jgi:hypothetical protein
MRCYGRAGNSKKRLSDCVTMEKYMLTIIGMLSAQVCSEGTWDEALAWIRRYNPAGTSNNWCKDTREEVKPVPCEKYPERTHYLFTC